MTVSELLDKLKDCAPGAEVWIWGSDEYQLEGVSSDGETVVLS